MSWGWSNWLSDWDEGTSTPCVIPCKPQTSKVSNVESLASKHPVFTVYFIRTYSDFFVSLWLHYLHLFSFVMHRPFAKVLYPKFFVSFLHNNSVWILPWCYGAFQEAENISWKQLWCRGLVDVMASTSAKTTGAPCVFVKSWGDSPSNWPRILGGFSAYNRELPPQVPFIRWDSACFWIKDGNFKVNQWGPAPQWPSGLWRF